MSGEDDKIQLRNIENGMLEKEYLAHKDHVYAMELLNDKLLASGGKDTFLFLWEWILFY